MRRTLIVGLLLLVACQGREADDRLKKVEKDLADIKANPPAATSAAPSTEPTIRPPASSLESQIGRVSSKAAYGLVQDAKAAYVSTKDHPRIGLVNLVPQHGTILYRWDDSPSVQAYRPLHVVASMNGPDGRITISGDQMLEMGDLLTLPGEEHALMSTGVQDLVQQHLAAYVPAKGDAYGGVVLETRPGKVMLYRFDGDYYLPVSEVSYPTIVQSDGKIVVSPQIMAALTRRLDPTADIPRDHPIGPDVADSLAKQNLAAYVPTKDDEKAGLVMELLPGQTVLYKFDGKNYWAFADVDNIAVNGKIVLTDAQRSYLQAILAGGKQ